MTNTCRSCATPRTPSRTSAHFSISRTANCRPNTIGGSARRPGGSNGYGGGGGGGAYARTDNIAVTPGNSYTVFVGGGGVHTTATISASGQAGASGTNSWFGTDTTTNCLAVGGTGGKDGYGDSGGGGTGGALASCIGTTTFSGGNGRTASSGGGGGGSSAGTGSNGNNATSNTGATAVTGGGAGGNGKTSSSGSGTIGGTPGGGGGGGFSSGSQQNGGDGAAGQVVLIYQNPTPSAYVIRASGNSSVTTAASSNVVLTVTALDNSGNQLTGFYQDVTLSFYGLANSPSNTVPKITDKLGASQTVTTSAGTPNTLLNFTNGIASVINTSNGVLKAYNGTGSAVTLNCTDGTASSASGTGASGLSLTVNPAPASRVVFTTAPQTIPVNTLSSTITVQRKDAFGNPNTTDADITVNLASDSGTGVFRDTANTTTIFSVTIPNGSSSASFKYTDSTLGTPTITASDAAAVLTSASQLEIVVALIWSATPANYNWNTTDANWTGAGTIYSDGNGVTFNDSGSAALPINLVGALSPQTVTVITSTNSYTFGGSGHITGSASLTKSGTSTLTIATANDYSGNTTILGGVVDVKNNTALGNGSTTVSSGAAVQVDGSGLNVAEPISLNGTGVTNSGALRHLANANTVSSAITLASDARINADAGTLTLSGGYINGATNLTVGGSGNVSIAEDISTSGKLTKDGTGTLTLSGNNSYPGATTVNAGVLSIPAASAVSSSSSIILNGGDLLSTSTSTLNNNIGVGPTSGSTAGTGLVDVASSQTLTLNGVVGSAGNTGANNLTVNSTTGNNGTLILGGANTFSGTTTISNGVLQIANSLALQNSTLNYSSGSLVFDSSITSATLGGLSGTQNIGLANAANNALALNVGNNNGSTTYSGNLSGAGSLTKWGSGTLSLTGSNNFAGSTTLTATSGGIIDVGAGAWLQTSAIFAQTNTTVRVNGGTLFASSASAIGGSGGGSGSSLLVWGGSATIGGTLTCQNQDGQFVAVTNGTLSAPSLVLNRTAAFSTAPTATTPINGATTTGLYVNGPSANVYLGSLSIGINNSSASARLDSGTLIVTNQVLVSRISSGSTRWSILHINGGTFTAPDTANGVVIAQNNGAFGCNGEFYVSGGVATVGRIGFGTASDTVGGNGFVILNNASLYVGSGGIVLANGNGYNSTISLISGTLGAQADWSTALPIQLSGSSINIKAADAAGVAHNITLNGSLSGGSSLTKLGNGVLTLGAACSYAGPTTNSAGTLQVNDSLASSVLVNGGTLAGIGTISGATTMNASSTIAAGNGQIGTLHFGGNLTLNAASTNSFAVTSSGSSNSVAVTGTLTPNNSIIHISSGSPLTGGTYPLFTYGSISGAFNATPVFDVNPAGSASIVDNGSGQVSLVVSSSTSAPTLTGLDVSGLHSGTVGISVTNGTPGGSFAVLASTNLTLPIASWTALATNQFNGNGAFTGTVNVNSTYPQQYIMLQVLTP